MKPLLSLLPIVLLLLASCSPGADATPAPIVEVPHEGTLRVAYSKQADPWIWIEGEGSRQLAGFSQRNGNCHFQRRSMGGI